MASYYHDGQDSLTNSDVGQADRFDELGLRGLYESPHLESDCLGTRLENTGELLMAARAEPEYDEFGNPIEGTGGYEIDAYWVGASLRTTQARDVDPMDLTDEDHTGLPLAKQEELHGLRDERKRQREKALAAHVVGIDRETRRREEVLTDQRARRADYEERIIGEQGMTRYDPFERLGDESTEQVQQAAARLSDQLIKVPGMDVLAHHLASKVVSGQTIHTALSNVQDQLYQEAGIIQPIATVPAIPSKYNVEADIQGEVTTLWQPKSRSQQQVGIIKDDSGTIKFTVWTRSNQGVILHEGDTVRIVAGKVGKYGGRATLAADSETRITVLERGDGPARRGDVPNVDWSKYAERARELGIEQPHQRHEACSLPSLGAPGVQDVSRPIHIPADRLDHEGSGKADAGTWLKATEIYDEDGDVPLPAWWREQANVVPVLVDDGADRAAIDDAIRETVSTTPPTGASDTPTEAPVPLGKRRLWVLVRDFDLFGTALEERDAASQTARSELTGVAGDASPTETTATNEIGLGLPTTTCTCPGCAHNRAHYRLIQLRSIDEPPTRLLSCTSCGQRWRADN